MSAIEDAHFVQKRIGDAMCTVMQLSWTICFASWSRRKSGCQYPQIIVSAECSGPVVSERAFRCWICGKRSSSQSLWFVSVSILWYMVGHMDFIRKLMKESTRSRRPDFRQSVRCVRLRIPLNNLSWVVVVRTPSIGRPSAMDAMVRPYCNQELQSGLCSHSFFKYSKCLIPPVAALWQSGYDANFTRRF